MKVNEAMKEEKKINGPTMKALSPKLGRKQVEWLQNYQNDKHAHLYILSITFHFYY